MFASIQNGAVMGWKGGREGDRMEGGRGTSVCTVTSEITIHINLHKNVLNEYDLWIKKLCSHGS